MTDEQIKKYTERAKIVANKYGRPELTDDFTQEMFLEFFENPDRGATVDQLFVDYLRKLYGRTGTPGGDAKSRAIHTAVSIDEPISDQEGSRTFADILPDTRGCSRDDISDSDCSHLFRGREAQIYDLYFDEQLTELTIAEMFGVTKSRISQIVGTMKKRMKEYFIYRECRSRMEWDEDFGVLQVDWIRF